jgi:hypothetical protein
LPGPDACCALRSQGAAHHDRSLTEPRIRRDDCQDCHADPTPDHIRTLGIGFDGRGTEIWHRPDCPQYTVDQILMEEGAKIVKRQEAWAKSAFPAAHARLASAAAALPDDSTAAPFIAALTDLVQAQADLLDHDAFVVLPHLD